MNKKCPKPKLVKCREGSSGFDLVAPPGHRLEIRYGGIGQPVIRAWDVHVNVLTQEDADITEHHKEVDMNCPKCGSEMHRSQCYNSVADEMVQGSRWLCGNANCGHEEKVKP